MRYAILTPGSLDPGVFFSMEYVDTIVHSILVATILIDGAFLTWMYYSGHRSHLQWLLLTHFFGILLWTFSVLTILVHESIFATHLAFAAAIVLAAAKYYFIRLFPDGHLPRTASAYVPFTLAILLFGLSFVTDFFFTEITVIDGYYIRVTDGPYALLYVVAITFFLLTPIGILIKKYRSGTYTTQISEQLKFLAIGVSLFFLIGLATNSLLPVVFDVYLFNGIGPAFALIQAGFIVYIINKHHFLDLSIVIQRGVIYTVIFIFIVSVYIVLLTVFGAVFSSTTHTTPLVSALITTLLGIFSVPHIDAFLRKKTDPFFFKDTYDYAEALGTVSEELNQHLSLAAIVKQTTATLAQFLKAETVRVRLHTETLHETAQYRPTLSIPLTSKNTLLGTLELGRKRSGELYTRQDLKLLNTVAHQLGMALERAYLHKKIADHSRELEATVKEQTAELRIAYEDQRAMVANISHSLQTPLAVMTGELDRFKESGLYSDRCALFEKSIADLSTFMYDLLRLTRLESNAETIPMNRINLSTILRDIMEYVTIPATDKGVTITTSIAVGIVLRGNAQKIEEMLLIFLSNAMQYMETNGERHIYVALNSTKSGATITIRDTGIGIPHEDLARIFTRFYRASNRMSHTRGSGLGLAIAQAIIDQHHGKVHVSSTLGIGTTFTITLPLDTADSPMDETSVYSSDGDVVPTAPAGSKAPRV